MKILYLGPYRDTLIDFIRSFGDGVIQTEERLMADDPILADVDFVVSYGYRYILREEFIARFPDRIVNLHISLLPYNRGADPNLWSFLEDTPRGVTIHSIDRGVDTGLIIAQEEVPMRENDTLRTSYARLTEKIERLFQSSWPAIRAGEAIRRPQAPGGTAHRLKDKKPYLDLLTKGWDTPVRELTGKALVEDEG